MRDPRIIKAEKRLAKARVAYAETVEAIQRECHHSLILERPGGSTGYKYIENSWLPPVRVCAACGYVEEARYGWPTQETSATPLYNTKPKSKSRLNRRDFDIDNERLRQALVQQSG